MGIKVMKLVLRKKKLPNLSNFFFRFSSILNQPVALLLHKWDLDLELPDFVCQVVRQLERKTPSYS